MTVLKKYGTFLFALILLSHCLFIYLGMSELRVLTKLLIIPFLIVYLYSISPVKPSLLVVCALVFSFAGDVLLTRSGELFFLLGMAAFIATHICNIILFLMLHPVEDEKDGRIVTAALAVTATLSVVVYKTTQPYLGDLKWAILVYMGIIGFMAVMASRIVNRPDMRAVAIKCFIPGAMLFMISDAILAENKFRFHETLLDIAVMFTYGLAQYFLVRGYARAPRVALD